MKDIIFDPPTKFDFKCADYVPFKDREVCERLRKLSGKELEKLLGQANITVNKNTIPDDPQSPFVTSGIRVGSPAVTSRGFTTADMDQVAQYIAWAATDFENKAEEIRQGVAQLTQAHPIYR